jgi:CBS domain-containing protein
MTPSMIVAALMDHQLHKATPSTTVGEAAVIMARAKVGSTLVMEGDRLLGIFTERDVVRALSRSVQSPADPVSGWMTPNPQTIFASDAIEVALRRMLSGGFRHLPVVDTGGRVVGMLSMRDLARAGVEGARDEWPHQENV